MTDQTTAPDAANTEPEDTRQQTMEALAGDETTGAQENTPGTEEGTSEVEENSQDEDGAKRGNKEAAKYRRRLRETEAERDELQGQLANMRQEFDQHQLKVLQRVHGMSDKQLAERLKIINLDGLRDAEGMIDHHLFEEHVATSRRLSLAQRGQLMPGYIPDPPEPTWSQHLRDK